MEMNCSGLLEQIIPALLFFLLGGGGAFIIAATLICDTIVFSFRHRQQEAKHVLVWLFSHSLGELGENDGAELRLQPICLSIGLSAVDSRIEKKN